MFSWNNFDSEFIKEILMNTDLSDFQKKVLQYAEEDDDKDGLISVMLSVCVEPDADFIKKYRKIMERSLFCYYKEELNKICKELNVSGKTFNDKINRLEEKSTSPSLITAYICVLYNIAGIETDFTRYSKFKTTIALRMADTKAEEIGLHDFQKEAVEKLKKHFITDDNNSGIMVMPTGSGKTRTSSYFLIKEMISQGYQVVWIAHRHMLIDQAADCFYEFAGLSKIKNPGIKKYNICCISGEHRSIKQADKEEVIVATIQSICRSKEHLKRILKRGKVMVVVDECHHSVSKTYQETIKFIRKHRSNVKLLGLTATPVRVSESGTAKLMDIFDNNIIYEISMSELITRKILADPKYIKVYTHVDFEPEISLDEAKYINRRGDLPETLASKIADSKQRNKIILNQYLENAEEYGKTLIFALNIVHCRLLYEELSQRGIKCGQVYSGKEDNAKVISDFKNGEIDVLVNVSILSEGSDVPDIQTVFLTRPTASEGFLMQMIGRGMRGPSANGTETVNIVDFHDKWTVFNRWLDPEWVIADEYYDEENQEAAEYRRQSYEKYEWKLCLELYNSIKLKTQEYECSMTVPSGWYTLIDENGEIVRMLVFEDQITGLKNMREDKESWINNPSFTGASAIQKYFNGFVYVPQEKELSLLIDNYRTLEDTPTLHLLKEREFALPSYAIELSEKEDRDIFSVGSELYEEHEIIRNTYSSKEDYLMELSKVKIYGKSSVVRTRIEELPYEKIPFDRTPVHDIEALYGQVVDEMFGGEYDGISGIAWTDKAYKTYFGVYYPESHLIRINSVLNSPDVEAEVIKFVIYHEMLHRDFHKHDKVFRDKEHEYPNYAEYEHFLDCNMNNFEIVEW